MHKRSNAYRVVFALLLGGSLTACSFSSNESAGTVVSLPQSADAPAVSPPPPPTPVPQQAMPTPAEASRFLISASFGPTEETIENVVDLGYSGWLQEQFQLPMRSVLDASMPDLVANQDETFESDVVLSNFYENAILGEDQLRVRATYALSQIFVISTRNTRVRKDGEGFARYVDIMQEGAFGNFRDLLEEVTYSPVMGAYLTYAGNRKANPAKGSAPDENYAREIMQLFTIGLYELNIDGTLKLDAEGQPIETYSNADVQGLAKVFTGLWYEGLPFAKQRNSRTQKNQISRMVLFEEEHAAESKSFLGETLSPTLTGDESINAALDILFEHPNTAPFLSIQLIQRFTTSNPSPAYVRRVATAFNQGAYRLPNGNTIGSGERGDMRAVWGAILMDEEFKDPSSFSDASFGKVREPVLLFTHWARMSKVPTIGLVDGDTVIDQYVLGQHNEFRLGQRPFTSPSVFNFYRPGYVAAGSQTARAGLVAPELQITNATSVLSYANFMRTLVFRDEGAGSSNGSFGLIGDYSDEIELARDAGALIERLDLLLLANTMTPLTRHRLEVTIKSVKFDESNADSRLRNRVQLAVQLLMVSPEYMVQQ